MTKQRSPPLSVGQILIVATHQSELPVSDLDQPSIPKTVDGLAAIDEAIANYFMFHTPVGVGIGSKATDIS